MKDIFVQTTAYWTFMLNLLDRNRKTEMKKKQLFCSCLKISIVGLQNIFSQQKCRISIKPEKKHGLIRYNEIDFLYFTTVSTHLLLLSTHALVRQPITCRLLEYSSSNIPLVKSISAKTRAMDVPNHFYPLPIKNMSLAQEIWKLLQPFHELSQGLWVTNDLMTPGWPYPQFSRDLIGLRSMTFWHSCNLQYLGIFSHSLSLSWKMRKLLNR